MTNFDKMTVEEHEAAVEKILDLTKPNDGGANKGGGK